MKKLLFTMTAISAVYIVNAAGLYIPKTTENNIRSDYLNVGESAWIADTNSNTATIFIGNGTKSPYKAVDNGALRGFRNSRILEDGEFGISTDEYMTTDGNGNYTTTHVETYQIPGSHTIITNGIKGSLTVSVVSKYVINKITYSKSWVSDTIGVPHITINKTMKDDNTCVFDFYLTAGSCSSFTLSDIKVSVYDLGESYYVNDTTDRTFMIKDDEGTYNLRTLRNELYHKYDGNRGEHWSNYAATNDVALNGKSIVFGTNSLAGFSSNGDNVNFFAYNNAALELKIDNSTTNDWEGTLEITAIDTITDKSTCQISYLLDIKKGDTTFNPERLQVIYADSLDKDKRYANGNIRWIYLIYNQDYTVTDLGNGTGVVDVPYNRSNDKGFYKLKYGNLISEIMSINFNVPIFVKKGLYLTGDDGITYKISINGGTLSITSVE